MTSIKYGKILTVITENETTGTAKVETFKVSKLREIIQFMTEFKCSLNNTVLKRTVKKIQEAGFSVTINEDYGFEWESLISCHKNT
jgi:hypothetical protein